VPKGSSTQEPKSPRTQEPKSLVLPLKVYPSMTLVSLPVTTLVPDTPRVKSIDPISLTLLGSSGSPTEDNVIAEKDTFFLKHFFPRIFYNYFWDCFEFIFGWSAQRAPTTLL
jgi:hypothetical protein